MIIHFGVLGQFAVRLVSVSNSLLEPAVEGFDLIISAFFDFSKSSLLLSLQLIHSGFKIS